MRLSRRNALVAFAGFPVLLSLRGVPAVAAAQSSIRNAVGETWGLTHWSKGADAPVTALRLPRAVSSTWQWEFI